MSKTTNKAVPTLKNKTSRLVRSIDVSSRKTRIFVIVTIGVVGVVTLLFAAAASFSIMLQTESGNISGNACTGTDSSSGDSFVKFGDCGTSTVPFSTEPGRAIPDTLYGVTTESVDNLSALNTSLSRHSKRPMTRIVFQNGMNVSSYTSAVNTLRNNSYIMGEILDSTGLESISVANYKTRAQNFVSAFGNKIDIWEIGNELNGEWVGTPTDINAKVQAAYDVVEKEYASSNLRSAVTLNYWPSSNCYSYSWEDTLTFARAMPAEVRNGTDYVLLSFYETACSPRAYPTDQQFIDVFNQLKTIFPNSKLGMGEIGAQGKDDGLSSDPTLAEKQRIANRYYGMHGALKTALGPRYTGGYYWWYYFQDAVPYNKSNSMWQTIEDNFNSY